MSKLGSTLKEKRESLGIEVDKVTEDTRISADVLAVLEEGRFGEMPSYNHAKNFVKNYAEYLKLDYEKIYDLFIEECSKDDFNKVGGVDSPAVFTESLTEEASSSSSGALVKLIIPVIIIAVIGFSGFKVFMAMDKAEENRAAKEAKKEAVVEVQPEAKPEPVVLDEHASDKADSVAEVIENIKKDTESSVVPENKEDKKDKPVEAEVKKDKKDKKEVVKKEEEPSYSAFMPDMQDEPASEAKTAVINFADVCWVHVKIDDKSEMDFIAEKGTSREVTFHDTFIMDIGNAAVVSVSYNNRTIAGLGAYKQPVKGLKFSVNDKNRLVYRK